MVRRWVRPSKPSWGVAMVGTLVLPCPTGAQCSNTMIRHARVHACRTAIKPRGQGERFDLNNLERAPRPALSPAWVTWRLSTVWTRLLSTAWTTCLLSTAWAWRSTGLRRVRFCSAPGAIGSNFTGGSHFPFVCKWVSDVRGLRRSDQHFWGRGFLHFALGQKERHVIVAVLNLWGRTIFGLLPMRYGAEFGFPRGKKNSIGWYISVDTSVSRPGKWVHFFSRPFSFYIYSWKTNWIVECVYKWSGRIIGWHGAGLWIQP